MTKKTVYFLGEDDFGFARLQQSERRHDWHVRPLLHYDDIQKKEGYRVAELMARAEKALDASDDLAGVTGYWDFPVSSMTPMLCKRYGLPGPSLESVLKCEHKYWSRLIQHHTIPEMVPEFKLVNPYEQGVVARWDFGYPFWLKPVKSWSSQLGFMVRSPEDFEEALGKTRAKIHRFAEPFNWVLQRADLPGDIAAIDGYYCMAERLISGRQCTLEGFVSAGLPRSYGIFDSMRYEGVSSFSRYQYPSRLPEAPRLAMAEAAYKFMEAIGYDQATFNIEFFWDEEANKIWLLEVNPRLSVSHADISLKVDGISNLERMADLAAGETPPLHKGAGEYEMAAKFMYRHFEDAFVERVPHQEEVAAIEREVGGTTIQITAKPGQTLSELLNQDSYSYELALIHIGANSDEELEAKYRAVIDKLPFIFKPAA